MSLADPAISSRFLARAARGLPWLAGASALAFGLGLALTFGAPDDYRQGATVKIMFLHVPSAWLITLIWAAMSLAALATLVWRHPLADVAAKTAAPLGAAFTFLCLVTGSLWERPMLGTYWVWDGRQTSVLVLFLMYLGLIVVYWSEEHLARVARLAAVLILCGSIMLPVMRFSVAVVEQLAPAGRARRSVVAVDAPVDPDAAVADGAGVHSSFHDAAGGGDAQ